MASETKSELMVDVVVKPMAQQPIVLEQLTEQEQRLVDQDRKKMKHAQISFMALLQVPPVDHILDTTEFDAGLVEAFRCLQKSCKVLYDLNFEDHPFAKTFTFSRKEWQQKLENMQLGVIKETTSCGSSSVSMGVNADMYSKTVRFMGEPNNLNVMLNCGTGGIKAQIYWKNARGILRCLGEVKEFVHNPNPNAQPFSSYVPENPPPCDEREEKLNFRTFMLAVSLRVNDLYDEIPELKEADPAIVYYGFITGPLRQHWEKLLANKDMEAVTTLEKAVAGYLSYVPTIHCWNGKSFFMSQDQEGTFEQVATGCMYSQMYRMGLLPDSVRVVQTWGKGRGSAQLGPFKGECLGKGGENRLVAKLETDLAHSGLAQTFYDEWSKVGDSTTTMPLVALKSQFALLYEQSITLRASLATLTYQAREQKKAVVMHVDSPQKVEKRSDDLEQEIWTMVCKHSISHVEFEQRLDDMIAALNPYADMRKALKIIKRLKRPVTGMKDEDAGGGSQAQDDHI